MFIAYAVSYLILVEKGALNTRGPSGGLNEIIGSKDSGSSGY